MANKGVEKCPICKSDMKLMHIFDKYHVACANPDCPSYRWYDSPDDAIADWNKVVSSDKETNVVIEVKGGMVQNVYSDNKNVVVDVADFDTDDPADEEAAESVLEIVKEQGYSWIW